MTGDRRLVRPDEPRKRQHPKPTRPPPCPACAGRRRAADIHVARATEALREELAVAIGEADELRIEIAKQSARIAALRRTLGRVEPAVREVFAAEIGAAGDTLDGFVSAVLQLVKNPPAPHE